jgi:DNA-binding beta-propeller fold protein YncE
MRTSSIIAWCITAVLVAAFFPAPGRPSTEWELVKSIDTSLRATGVAASPDGRRVYVLSDDRQLLIYTQEGLLTKTPIGSRPLDVAVSNSGRLVYVLAENGVLLVYSPEGVLSDQISLGGTAERIAVAPDEERVYVTRPQGKRVDLVQIDYVRDINLAGAPFKGPEKAPVVIAVFSDFQ